VTRFQVKIQGQNEEMLLAACEQFLGKTEEEIQQVATSFFSIPISDKTHFGQNALPDKTFFRANQRIIFKPNIVDKTQCENLAGYLHRRRLLYTIP
jgi:hypothetical protein